MNEVLCSKPEMKFLLVLLTLTLRSAQSLNCYVTDFKALETKGDVRSTIKSCKDFFFEVSGQKNLSYFPNYKDNLRCFTVDVESDKVNFAIQGCALEDSCGKITNEIPMKRWSFIQNVQLYNMTCTECLEENCNRRAKKMRRASSEKTKYLIFTVVMILIFMVVVSVMLRAFTRKAGIAKKKYTLLNV